MAGSSRKPHLIVLMASQLRADMLGAFGDRQCPTPKLDILAGRSTVFGRHYTPCPLSVPARASIMTGLTPHRHGAVINGWLPGEAGFGAIRPDLPLLPEALLDAGYRVVHAGLQLVRSDPDFQIRLPEVEFLGPTTPAEHHAALADRGLMLGDLSELRDPVIEHSEGRPTVFSASSPRTALFPLREDLFYDWVIADRAVDAVREHAAKGGGTPLALFGMFWLPHAPLWAPRKWAELVDPASIELPATVGRWYKGMPVVQLANVAGQLGAHVGLAQWRQAWAMYMGMTALLDRCVGRVLAALDHTGMLNDSLIVFTADHGEMLGSHRLFGKMCMYEPAVRTPLLIKGPGQTSARSAQGLTDHLDLTATLLAYAGAEPWSNTPGVSLRSPIEGRGRSATVRDYVFASYDGNAGRGYAQRMVRSRTHKLVHHHGGAAELYDLVEDPAESRNLAGDAELTEVEATLRQALNAWMDARDDPMPRC